MVLDHFIVFLIWDQGYLKKRKHHFASTIAHLTSTTYLLYCTGGVVRVKTSRLDQQASTAAFTDCPSSNHRGLSILSLLLHQ